MQYVRPDQYDFLDATTFDPNQVFVNLPAEKVSQDIADGMVLLWGKDPVGVSPTPGSGNIDEAVAERSEDDELLLRATDAAQS